MKLLRNSLVFLVAVLSVYVLVVAKDLLIPLVLALFAWYLITNLKLFFARLTIGGWRLPRPLAFGLALLTICLAAGLILWLITENISQVAAAAPRYQANLERWYSENLMVWAQDLLHRVGPVNAPDADDLFRDLNVASYITRSAGALASLMSNTGLVVIYLLFLFFEERYFDDKLKALFPNPERRAEVTKILSRIGADTRAYVSLKTLVSALTSFMSYAIMKLVGLDYSEFWAILIFILNFIPNLGSLIATILPSLLSLVQFENPLRPFLVVAGGVTAVQLFVANVLEPRLLGRSLNLSPLVIILSLVLWATLWGVAGMFLCVPLMVVLMIVFSHFPQTRPIAILLSQDGRVTERDRDELRADRRRPETE